MPANDGGGFNEGHRRPPAFPESREEDPKQSVRGQELRAVDASLQDCKLLAEGQNLQDEIGTVLEQGSKEGQAGRNEGYRSVPVVGLR